MNKHLIIKLLVLMTLMASCHHRSLGIKDHSVLLFDSENSIVTNDKFPRDSIVVKHCSNDSILFLTYSNGSAWKKIYLPIDDNIYEKRYKVDDTIGFHGIDTILTFTKKDTSFFYKSVMRFIPHIFLYSEADCEYTIKKERNGYVTIKQSVIDTTFKEIFYYDENYRINKYVNTWRDNTCVYVEKNII